METLYVKNRREWRGWLAKNAAKNEEIWIVYYKKSSGKLGIPYGASVEEALCFGWIDSIIKKIDEDRFVRKFTPRKPSSQWAASNIARVQRLIKARKMTAAGLAAFQTHATSRGVLQPTQFPKRLEITFGKEKAAWENFNKFPPAYRRMTIGWVASAKKEETQLSRLAKLIECSARNERIKFM